MVRRCLRLAVPVSGVIVGGALVASRLTIARVDLIKKAAGIPSHAAGVGGFINAVHALTTPAMVVVVTAAPLAIIAGLLVMLFGGRRGPMMILTALGVLIALGSLSGIVD